MHWQNEGCVSFWKNSFIRQPSNASSLQSLRSGDYAQKRGKLIIPEVQMRPSRRYLDGNIASASQRAGLRKDRTGSGEAKLEEIKLIENQTNEGKRHWVITTQITSKEKDYPLNGYLSLVIHHDGTQIVYCITRCWKGKKSHYKMGMTLKR